MRNGKTGLWVMRWSEGCCVRVCVRVCVVYACCGGYVWEGGETCQKRAGVKQGPAMFCQSGRGAPVIFNSPAGGWWLVRHDNRASVSMTMLMIFFLPSLLGIGRDRGRKAGGNILCPTRAVIGPRNPLMFRSQARPLNILL